MFKEWWFHCKSPVSGPLSGGFDSVRPFIRLTCAAAFLAVANPLFAQNATEFNEPLVDAIEQDNLTEAGRLLRERHPANSRGKFDVTPLMRAAFKGNFTMTEMLLSAGANPNAVDVGGATALHLAARQDNTDIVKMLIRYGAYVDMADAEGWTPLMRAVAAGKQNTVRLLMESGADVNAINKQNESPLIKAAETRNSKLVRLLLMGGANPQQVNAKGQSAVDVAREKNDPEVLTVLAPYQSPVDAAVSAAAAAPPGSKPAQKPFFVLSVRDANAPAAKQTDTAAMARALTDNYQRGASPGVASPAPSYQIRPAAPVAPVASANLPANLDAAPAAPPEPFSVDQTQSIEDIRKEADRMEAEKIAAAKLIADEEESKARLEAAKRAAEKIEQARIEAAKQAAGAIEAAKVAKAKEDAAKEAEARIEAAKKAIEAERKQREIAAAAPPVTVIDNTPPAPPAPAEALPTAAPTPEASVPKIDPALPPVVALPPLPEIAAAKEAEQPLPEPKTEAPKEPKKTQEKKAEKKPKAKKPASTEARIEAEPVDQVIVRVERPEEEKPPALPELPEALPATPDMPEKQHSAAPKEEPKEEAEKSPPPASPKPEVKPADASAKTEEELDREQTVRSTEALLARLEKIKKEQADVPKQPVKEPEKPAEKVAPKAEIKPEKPLSDAEFWQQLAALESKAFAPVSPGVVPDSTPAANPTPNVAASDLPPLAGTAPSAPAPSPEGPVMEPNFAKTPEMNELEAIVPGPAAGGGPEEEVMVPDAIANQEGMVEVAEAVRVPLSLPKNIRVIPVPVAKPNFDIRSGGWFGSTKDEPFRGYWIELSPLANEEEAFQLFDKTIAREGLSLRMKTLSSERPDGSAITALRVGNFNSSQDAATACSVFKEGSLSCSVVYELGKGTPIRALALAPPTPPKVEDFTYDSNPDRAIFWLQLGSFKDEATVVESWKGLSEKHKDVLDQLKLSIQVPKGIGLKDNRYQMRAGPLYSRFEASDRCRKLKEREVNCLPVRGD